MGEEGVWLKENKMGKKNNRTTGEERKGNKIRKIKRKQLLTTFRNSTSQRLHMVRYTLWLPR